MGQWITLSENYNTHSRSEITVGSGPGSPLTLRPFSIGSSGREPAASVGHQAGEVCQTLQLHTDALPGNLRSLQGLGMQSTLQAGAETEGITQGRGNSNSHDKEVVSV